MEKVREIILEFEFHRKDNRALSIPFLVYDEKLFLASFSYAMYVEENKKFVSFADELIMDDGEGDEVAIIYIEDEYRPKIFPLEIVYDDGMEITKEKIEEYYDCLDEIMSSGKINIEKYKKLFYAICPKSLKPIYDYFGAEFID